MFGSEKVIYEGDTELEHYMVVERIYEGRPARVLFSGRQRAAQSGIALDDDSDLLFDYNQRFLELVNAVYPKKVLLIGGGVYTLPMALLAALPEVRVDVVELDAGLDEIAKTYFGFKADDRLQVIHADGREYLETTTETYDMILVDAFSELNIPKSLLTVQATYKLSELLNDGGIVAMNIISAYQGRNAGAIRSQVAAYARYFKRIDIFPAAHGLTSWLPQNLLLVAQKDQARDFTKYLRFAPIPPLQVTADEVIEDE